MINTDPLAFGKMAFVSGPRQCGKTTLAESLLVAAGHEANYFNWDDVEFRRLWLHSPAAILPLLHIVPGCLPLLVFIVNRVIV